MTTEATTLTAATVDLTEAAHWHREAMAMATHQGDDLRLMMRWDDAEALRLQGLNPQRAAMVLL